MPLLQRKRPQGLRSAQTPAGSDGRINLRYRPEHRNDSTATAPRWW